MAEQKNLEETMMPKDEASAHSKGVTVKKEAAEASFKESPFSGKTQKHSKAKSLIEKAKKIADETAVRTEACRRLLEDGLSVYEEARSALKQDTLEPCISLLKQSGYQVKREEERPAGALPKQKSLRPFVPKSISSGRATGFFYALAGGIVTAMGMVYLSTQKLEMTLDPARVPTENEMDSILAWFSTIIGVQENVAIGTAVLGFTVLSVMLLVYLVHRRLKARNDLHLAVKQFVEAELYAEQQPDCTEEMKKLDAHIQDTIGTLKAYQVLLNEQKGKLQRILYFEGEKEKGASYHSRSLAEIEETKELVERIIALIEVPVVEDGKIHEQSIHSLQRAKEKLYAVIKRF
ncbi:MAG TPA: hypothetical protein VIM88_04755 [Sulfurovum sp.]|uniref:hypothetical protein n=1 Tax=Sulfurovum sp. TaxID=1969726 RepID=UPI002F95D3B0